MAREYVDDHRLYLYRTGGASEDITDFISGLTARDERNALSVELSFSVLDNPRDALVPDLDISPGDKVRVVNHGLEVFSGTVVTVSLDGSVTAYDLGWYLNKSQIIFQAAGVAADDAISRLCAKAGIPLGGCVALPTRIQQVWSGNEPSTILQDILDICAAETGDEYVYRVASGKLWVNKQTKEPIAAYHKPADNLSAFPITWALGEVSGSDSMEDLVNRYILTESSGEEAKVLGTAENPQSIATYGLIQKVESLGGDEDTAQARQRLKNLLATGDRLTRTRDVSQIWGCDEVRSGVVLSFGSDAYGLSGLYRVESVTHDYGKPHLMSLTLTEVDPPRAAGSDDMISV